MNSQQHTPLSGDELLALDAFLLSEEVEDERLPIDEVHGYLTALIVSALPVDQATWMEAVWGDLEFADDAEKECMTGYLLRMYGEISETLEQGHSFEPLIIEEEDEEGELLEAYEGWCFGFMRAVADHQSHWEDVPKNEQELLSPIAKLALLCTEEEMDEEMDEEEYEVCIDLLPGAVAGLYAFWHGVGE
jgi:yecA family protein